MDEDSRVWQLVRDNELLAELAVTGGDSILTCVGTSQLVVTR